MTRRASIEIDLAPLAAAPETWTPERVKSRLVEAYQIERRLPSVVKYFNGTSWPDTTDSFADRVYQGELAREAVLDKWERSGACTAADLSRMDQAHEWLRTILANHHVERACLSQWATATAYHRPLRSILARKRWSRTTFYKRRNDGAEIIATSLNADGLPVS